MYTYSDVSHRENLHNTIMKLHEQGWGYTKIHRHLRENGFQIGKSRTTVYSMIKRIEKPKRSTIVWNNKPERRSPPL